jgi:hypothetical protein
VEKPAHKAIRGRLSRLSLPEATKRAQNQTISNSSWKGASHPMASGPTFPAEQADLPVDKAYSAKAYAAQSADSGLASHTIQRRAMQPNDIRIQILYCGVCHTDVHWSRNDWSDAIPAVYPIVPGHEIVGA